MTKKIILAAIALAVGGVAYYGISPIFRHVRVDDAAPTALKADSPTNAQSDTHTDGVMQESVHVVVGTAGHPGSGSVRVINTVSGSVVRYENFKTLNGPDLYVYLSNDLEAKDFVSLGRLKATEGNVNYDVPAGVDAGKYKYVLTWCKTFSVLFNYARIGG